MNNSDIPPRLPMVSLWDFPVALALLTRLPLPHLPDHAFARQARTGWAFGFVGLVIGGLAAALGWAALQIGLPVTLAAGLTLAVQIGATGAMHEDGLADTADGLWGGFTRDRRLEIMKDSAIGTYGVLALILSLGLRWAALTVLIPGGPVALLVATCLSRAILPVVMTALPQARPNGLSHSIGRPGWTISALALALGLSLSALLAGVTLLLPCLVACVAVTGLALIAWVKIGGQTGDILGAAQQVGEISILLTFTVYAP